MKKLLFTFLMILFTFPAFAQEIVEGDITTNRVLTNNNSYLLRGFVRIQPGATLTIEPGTIIFGENSSQGTLIVKPGGTLIADGTVNQPIVFTSEFAKQGSNRTPTYGDWGGIIVLGNAPINVPGGTASIEGPGDSYGGNNPEDNSGIIRFVRIEYSGIPFSLNNEINGLTMGGVGSNTIIEYVQVSFCGDDSFEWFGGNVNAKYLVANRGWDDDFDTDFGYSGKLQYLVSLRDPEIADQSSSNGFESDNDGTGSDNSPLTSPTWYNVTMVGPKQTSTTVINSLYRRGMHLRRNSQNKIHNTIVMGWPTGVLLDGSKTINGAINGTNYIKNSIVSGSNVNKNLDTVSASGANFNIGTWFANNGGRVFDSNTEVMLMNPFSFSSPDFRPVAGSPALSGAATPPNDGFFDQAATFVGAFGAVDWTAGWTDWNPIGYPTTSVENENEVLTTFELKQNYPNPFNPTTTIRFTIPEAGNVKLTVYNLLGQEVAALVNEFRNAGSYEANWDASSLVSGIYTYRLETGSNSFTRKMSLLK